MLHYNPEVGVVGGMDSIVLCIVFSRSIWLGHVRRRRFWLWTVGVDSADRERVALFVTAVGLWGQLNDGMQGDLDVREVGLREIVEVCI